jgi:hypothetical protein
MSGNHHSSAELPVTHLVLSPQACTRNLNYIVTSDLLLYCNSLLPDRVMCLFLKSITSLCTELYRGTSESAQFNFLSVKIKVTLKSVKNNGYSTSCTVRFWSYLVQFYLVRNVSDKSCRGYQNKNFLFIVAFFFFFFSKIVSFVR